MRVAVIGAGTAGLSAGRRLSEAGVSAVVLEADESRAGGRILSLRLPESDEKPIELGASWLHAGAHPKHPVNALYSTQRRTDASMGCE